MTRWPLSNRRSQRLGNHPAGRCGDRRPEKIRGARDPQRVGGSEVTGTGWSCRRQGGEEMDDLLGSRVANERSHLVGVERIADDPADALRVEYSTVGFGSREADKVVAVGEKKLDNRTAEGSGGAGNEDAHGEVPRRIGQRGVQAVTSAYARGRLYGLEACARVGYCV